MPPKISKVRNKTRNKALEKRSCAVFAVRDKSILEKRVNKGTRDSECLRIRKTPGRPPEQVDLHSAGVPF